MQESPFIEYLMQKGIEQGARETSIKIFCLFSLNVFHRVMCNP